MNGPHKTTSLNLPKPCLDHLNENMGIGVAKKGERLVPFGRAMPCWVLVLDGLLVSETNVNLAHSRPVKLTAESGMLVPTSAPGHPRFSVYAASESTFAILSKAKFDEAFSMWPEFAVAMFQSSLLETAALQVSHARIAGLPLQIQIANLLWSLVPSQKITPEGEKQLHLKIPQQLLGDYFGVTREEANKKLKVLTTEGLIVKTDYGFLLTQDLRQLMVEQGGTTEPSSFSFNLARYIRDNTTPAARYKHTPQKLYDV